jgi:hypothetical protein
VATAVDVLCRAEDSHTRWEIGAYPEGKYVLIHVSAFRKGGRLCHRVLVAIETKKSWLGGGPGSGSRAIVRRRIPKQRSSPHPISSDTLVL